MGKLGISLMNVKVLEWFFIIVERLVTLVPIFINLRRRRMSNLVETFLLSVVYKPQSPIILSEVHALLMAFL